MRVWTRDKGNRDNDDIGERSRQVKEWSAGLVMLCTGERVRGFNYVTQNEEIQQERRNLRCLSGEWNDPLLDYTVRT